MRRARVNRSQSRVEISLLLKKMALSQTAVKLCEEEATAAEESFLLKVLEGEMVSREEARRARFLHEAAFPVYKSFEGFDFSSVKLPPALPKEELLSAGLVAKKQNLVLYGPVGTGKTHLATALGVAACLQQSIHTRFFTAAELVVKLSEAFKEGSLEKFLKSILRAELLIIDEWGYVPLDRQGAQLLFRIIAESYERRSIVLTTNLEFSKWGTIFTDDQMAAAIIDRLAHHGHIVLFEGESYRMKHALMRQREEQKLPMS
jgi:DNA replication protein DnaC